MNAKKFLDELESQGVRLTAKDEQLTVSAPEGLIGEMTLEELTFHKRGIIEELGQRNTGKFEVFHIATVIYEADVL
jgi:hypothetical protein